ncbi:Uncharacterized conserved protein, DUF58 family, contains vWF domain [Colwellia chukchiensis]|uniref:Uncharacterized conserved protein, DUF58 family, contains vWF domain n=1 Tax=Colwellia chukchiensis TaxID=641665 RepID=A0A1H7KM84_9GAMM|nr:DUF58 domain-containing protein [Colwellia chukchiensis]SEK87941.1 Uncharacterized conserved protein, DUF58 family, contains vWF domain [Colwellia chukchiensis]
MLKHTQKSLWSRLFRPIQVVVAQRVQAWITRRMPQAAHQSINYKNIFIMPTRFGASFLFFTLLLFLLGTNYQNNVIILLSYLLVSFFIVVLHHSFFNLSGLRFRAEQSIQGFVASQVYFPLQVSSDKKRFNIGFSFVLAEKSQSPDVVTMAQLPIGHTCIQVPYRLVRRGQYSLPRVLIASEYGFGLFKTWTSLDFAQQVTAFPKPMSYCWADASNKAASQQTTSSIESYHSSGQAGQDEFYQLQSYQTGEPLSRVAWKHVARGQGWLTKHYQQALSAKLHFDFSSLPQGSTEQRLSWLSFAIKDSADKQLGFSLTLPNQSFSYDNGREHTLKCLTALAKF